MQYPAFLSLGLENLRHLISSVLKVCLPLPHMVWRRSKWVQPPRWLPQKGSLRGAGVQDSGPTPGNNLCSPKSLWAVVCWHTSRPCAENHQRHSRVSSSKEWRARLWLEAWLLTMSTLGCLTSARMPMQRQWEVYFFHPMPTNSLVLCRH